MQGNGANALVQGDQKRCGIGIADDDFGRQGSEGIPVQKGPETTGGRAAASAPDDIYRGVSVKGEEIGGAVFVTACQMTVSVSDMQSNNDAEAPRLKVAMPASKSSSSTGLEGLTIPIVPPGGNASGRRIKSRRRKGSLRGREPSGRRTFRQTGP